MEKQVYKIDEIGYLKEIYVKEFDTQGKCTEDLAENIITFAPLQGLYRAKWNGTEWIEDMSQEEIDTLNNVIVEPTIDESLMLAIADLDAQREADKIETQLAIAELAETLLGGTV